MTPVVPTYDELRKMVLECGAMRLVEEYNKFLRSKELHPDPLDGWIKVLSEKDLVFTGKKGKNISDFYMRLPVLRQCILPVKK